MNILQISGPIVCQEDIYSILIVIDFLTLYEIRIRTTYIATDRCIVIYF